jgi:hypothetical protein
LRGSKRALVEPGAMARRRVTGLADALRKVEEAAERRERAKDELAAATAQLHAAIREAYRVGASQTLLSDTSGYVRQRINQIVRERD